jgi:hypothetical protein
MFKTRVRIHSFCGGFLCHEAGVVVDVKYSITGLKDEECSRKSTVNYASHLSI